MSGAGWLVFNKRDALLWLLAAPRLHFPRDLAQHVARHFFYDWVPAVVVFNTHFNCLQSRVYRAVVEERRPMVIWDAGRCVGKSRLARAVAAAFVMRGQSVCFFDVNRRLCTKNTEAVYEYMVTGGATYKIILNKEHILCENDGKLASFCVGTSRITSTWFLPDLLIVMADVPLPIYVGELVRAVQRQQILIIGHSTSVEHPLDSSCITEPDQWFQEQCLAHPQHVIK